MHQDLAVKILKALDEVECRMRQLEHRLTGVRQMIHEQVLGGERGRHDISGYTKAEMREREWLEEIQTPPF